MAKKILIIDDNPEFVDATSNLLDAKGYQVVTAPDGKKGIELAKAENPDLILLDVMMTTKSEGFDTARAIQQDEKIKSTPIIIITGVRKEMNLPFGFEPDSDWLPVKAVLEKPIKPEVLLKNVQEHIKK
ncbi:MAG: response regulator [Phycisphaerae bacterium]|jgi:CheY-like chemotaxis protein